MRTTFVIDLAISSLNIHLIAKTLSQKNGKKEKAKQELIRPISLTNLFTESAHGRRICLLEFAIVLKLKDNKTENSSGEMQRLQMNLPRECGLISLLNSYLAFSFCHFSKTTLLQLGVYQVKYNLYAFRVRYSNNAFL